VGIVHIVIAVPEQRFFGTFFPNTISSTSQRQGAQPLYMYYGGLRRDGRKMIVRFAGDAYRYLDKSAAIKELLKGALEAIIRLHANRSTPSIMRSMAKSSRNGMRNRVRGIPLVLLISFVGDRYTNLGKSAGLKPPAFECLGSEFVE
jgi:hypothetical protein